MTLDPSLTRYTSATRTKDYREKKTGAHSERGEFLLDSLVLGDPMMVTRIDQLGRSAFDRFGIIGCIVDAKAQIPSVQQRHEIRDLYGLKENVVPSCTNDIAAPQLRTIYCGVGHPFYFNIASKFEKIFDKENIVEAVNGATKGFTNRALSGLQSC